MIAILLAEVLSPAFHFDILPGKGLVVEANGIPVIEGSLIQMYKPGWSKGYYSSNWDKPKISRPDLSTVQVSFTSNDGFGTGTVTYHATGNDLKVHFDLAWNGPEAADAEVAPGFLWAPMFQGGSLLADKIATRSLNPQLYKSEDVSERRFSPDATSYAFTTGLGTLTESSSIPLSLTDGRGSKQDWAKDRDVFWLGATDLPLSMGKHLTFDVDYRLEFDRVPSPTAGRADVVAVKDAAAFPPDTSHPPLIPKPETAQLDWSHPLVYTGGLSFPAGIFDHLDDFKASLARRFEVPKANRGSKKVAFDGGTAKLGLVPGGYKITITDKSISVIGQEDEGLVNGLNRLAALAYCVNGHLCFPTGNLQDQPHSTFRGVHLFVGKKALTFHERLWSRVLKPLGLNTAVLQCERTHWDCEPKIDGNITMPKADLVQLFKQYRKLGVDPIPLIQSYGHMQWFFANGQNLDIAADPQHPYAVDPSKPRTVTALRELWAEVIAALHPSTVHFGLDEVDLIGKPQTPENKTQFWGLQLDTLKGIASEHGVKMMLWGDQALAPGEAPDAALAEIPAEAANRRQAIPKGALIGDWHYIANSDPILYRDVLQLWKDNGMNPVASTWYRPENIAGFDAEAARLGCGTLQTTWCGYESSEANIVDSFDQFSAMVLAADYGWSGRLDKPTELGYDPAEVFKKMYFGLPSPLLAKPGFDLSLPGPHIAPFQIGPTRFGSPGKVMIASSLLPLSGSNGVVVLKTDALTHSLAFAVNTLVRSPEDGSSVAEIEVEFSDGKLVKKTLVYGHEIRSIEDDRPLPLAFRNKDGVCAIQMDFGPEARRLKSITVRSLNSYSGLAISGIEASL